MLRVWSALIAVGIVIAIFIGMRVGGGEENITVVQNVSFELDQSPQAQERREEIEQVQVSHENTFVHQDPNFSFAIPEGHTVGQIEERGGKTVVVQNTDTGLGFQLFVSAFDEDITLTQARVKQDLPSLIMQSVQTIPIAERTGVAFVSQNQTFGTSREVWFAYGSHLYQMSTYLENEALLLKVLETFRINI